MGLAEASAEMPEGCRKDALLWDREAVERRMVEAMDYLNRTSRSGYSPFAKDGPWGQIVANTDAIEAMQGQGAIYDEKLVETIGAMFDRVMGRRGALRAEQVTRMEQALDWIAYVPVKGQLRELVGLVLQHKIHCFARVDWLRVKRELGRGDSPDMLRMSYRRAMDRVVTTLNRKCVPVLTAASMA